MGRLQILRPRVPAIRTKLAPALPSATERIRGRALQAIRDRILSRDQGICRCATCISTGALSLAHEVEHRIPLWAGGTEDDGNRYAIARACHEAKSACEARMRHAGGWLATPCSCGRHGNDPAA